MLSSFSNEGIVFILSTGLLKVIKASAGSGKTYTLVKEYLSLALRSKDAGAYRKILAITFTNAAAAEMKERFVKSLFRFSQDLSSQDPMFDDIARNLNLSGDELRERSGKMFRHVLHNYSLLSITTIDSFTHRLIRSFAKDLHLSHDFGIEMDIDAFGELLVSECFEEMNNDAELTNYLVQFAVENLKDERNWDIKSELMQMAQRLTEEDSIEALKELDGISLEEFQEIRRRVYSKKVKFEKEVKILADEGLEILASNGLNLKDFSYSGSGYVSRFQNFADLEIVRPGKRYLDMLHNSDWAKKGIDSATASKINAHVPTLQAILKALLDYVSDDNLARYHLYVKVISRIYSLGLLSRLKTISERIKRENNILLISDFHQLVSEVVDESPAPFIYERIGMRYSHILIDEFQDTSALQWNNALPLIVNSLGEGKTNLLVGDAKQSIYRWRGGHPEQFVRLPGLHEKHTRHIEERVLHEHFAEDILDTNYRSAENIIRFNNRLYNGLKKYLHTNERVYDKLEQNTHREVGGYVQIDEVTGKDREETWPKTTDKILDAVKASLEAGYRPGDIAILVRKNQEASDISKLLKQNNYEVETSESFLLLNSPQVRTVIGYLGYLVNPSSKSAALGVVQALSEIRQDISPEGWVRSSGRKISKDFLPDLQKYLSGFFDFSLLDKSWSPYHLVVKLIGCFEFTVDVYLEFLLEHVRQKTLSEKYSMLNLVRWWDEKKEKLNITTAANEHSVKLMTVHKSKGLQFPVVIYPRFAGKKRVSEKWVSLDKEEFGISKARVNLSKPEEGETPLPEWVEEELMSNLDDLNICYVSTTRAEDRLYVINEISERGNFWLSEILHEELQNEWSDLLVSEGRWALGEESAVNRPYSGMSTETVSWKGVNSEPVMNFKVEAGHYQSPEMKFGEIIHYCLSVYNAHQDIDEVISKARFHNPHWSDLNFDQIKQHFGKIIAHPQVSQWYNPGLNVKAETDLVSASGKVLRPDRVVFYADHIDVVEFKTGVPKEIHEVQVLEYKTVLSELNSLPVNCYLVYTENVEVRQVS